MNAHLLKCPAVGNEFILAGELWDEYTAGMDKVLQQKCKSTRYLQWSYLRSPHTYWFGVIPNGRDDQDSKI